MLNGNVISVCFMLRKNSSLQRQVDHYRTILDVDLEDMLYFFNRLLSELKAHQQFL